jgi:hypothetical protein
MASETWSAILSGWPSVTDSEVNKKRSLNLTLLPLQGIQFGQTAARTGSRWITGAESWILSPHRTHSRTVTASTVRLAPWDALFYGNCRGRAGAIACSERCAKRAEAGFTRSGREKAKCTKKLGLQRKAPTAHRFNSPDYSSPD